MDLVTTAISAVSVVKRFPTDCVDCIKEVEGIEPAFKTLISDVMAGNWTQAESDLLVIANESEKAYEDCDHEVTLRNVKLSDEG